MEVVLEALTPSFLLTAEPEVWKGRKNKISASEHVHGCLLLGVQMPITCLRPQAMHELGEDKHSAVLLEGPAMEGGLRGHILDQVPFKIQPGVPLVIF